MPQGIIASRPFIDDLPQNRPNENRIAEIFDRVRARIGMVRSFFQNLVVLRLLKIFLCIVFFITTYRMAQNLLYFALESNIPSETFVSLKKNGLWHGFRIRGNVEDWQQESIKTALSLFPQKNIHSFSEGKVSWWGVEPKLTFYVLGKEDFNTLAPWYYQKRRVRQLDGFYSDGKIFIRKHLKDSTFLETVTHELIHAQSDYLVQGPWYFYQLKEDASLMDPLSGILIEHKKSQVEKFLKQSEGQSFEGDLNLLYSSMFDKVNRPNQEQPIHIQDGQSFLNSLSCCFVSLYSFLGDFNYNTHSSSEYWAENYMTFLLRPAELERKDPQLFEAIALFDRRLRYHPDSLKAALQGVSQVMGSDERS